jgi:hypothetical protein
MTLLTRIRDALPIVIPNSLVFLSPDRRKRLERWLRGREEFRRLQLADVVIVSFGKSGRTWLRLMLSRFYQVKLDLSEKTFLEFDNMHALNAKAPRVFFTHGNYVRDYTGNNTNTKDYENKKVVLLLRDPRDVAVSQYFQWKYRMRPAKKILNDYPQHGTDVSVFDFVAKSPAGLARVIDFMNIWARDGDRVRDLLAVRYEDMRLDTAGTLRRIVEFMATPGTEEQIREAVAFASIDNMRRLETRQVFWLSGRRLAPGDQGNPESFKVRRAKVGGYRDYFDDTQVAEIDAMVRDRLIPAFGYGEGEPAARPLAGQDAG